MPRFKIGDTFTKIDTGETWQIVRVTNCKVFISLNGGYSQTYIWSWEKLSIKISDGEFIRK